MITPIDLMLRLRLVDRGSKSPEWGEEQIRAYGRQERARGLRAAARQARRKGRAGRGYFSKCCIKSGEMCLACETRKELASWCDRRARAIEKGRK